MKIKNEKHAVFLSMCKWHWLAVTGNKTSRKYPRLKEDNFNNMPNYCTMCEYILNIKDLYCGYCFLDFICEYEYHTWTYSKTKKERKKSARMIFEFIYQYWKTLE